MSVDLKDEAEVKEYIKNLGTEYRFGCYSEKKPEVCHLLGDYLEAISKDYEKAARVYKSNCDDYNYAKSCYKTAGYILAGRGGLKQSKEKGLEYYEKGCKLGDRDSCFRSGILNILNSKTAQPARSYLQGMAQLGESCEGDHADACHHLSAVYMDGEAAANVERDMSKAFEYAVKACRLGSIHACVNVSIMYNRGDGVARDAELSDRYKRRAVDLKAEMEQKRQLVFQEGLKPV